MRKGKTMQIKKIIPGHWYETNVGVGECLKSGGTYPPSVQIRIVFPFPRGVVNLRPRDVICEVVKPE